MTFLLNYQKSAEFYASPEKAAQTLEQIRKRRENAIVPVVFHASTRPLSGRDSTSSTTKGRTLVRCNWRHAQSQEFLSQWREKNERLQSDDFVYYLVIVSRIEIAVWLMFHLN